MMKKLPANGILLKDCIATEAELKNYELEPGVDREDKEGEEILLVAEELRIRRILFVARKR